MSPLPASFTPGLPPAGAEGAWLGRDAQGNLFLLRWHETNGWEALGWFGSGKAAMPALRHPAGEDQGLIVGHVAIDGSQPVAAGAQEEAARRLGLTAKALCLVSSVTYSGAALEDLRIFLWETAQLLAPTQTSPQED